ncbi:MAG TPA: hypothetical protein VGV93_12005 [Acidimicrobiales bacterium]|nr:hypothetical protein [Acidimicrobiales bacterium]
MDNRSKLLVDFERAFDGTDEIRALESLDLSNGEASELAAGIVALPEPIRAACQVVLDDWEGLGADARVAALLVLANALADSSDATGWS